MTSPRMAAAALAGVPAPKEAHLDGEGMSNALLGHPQSRPTPFLWEYGRQRDYLSTRRIRRAQSESRHPRWSMKAPPQR